MHLYKKSLYLLLHLLFLTTTVVLSQNKEVNDSLNIKIKNAARKIMSSANTCAFITLDKEGSPRVRVMDPFPLENDFTVWLATNPKSRKVTQIKHDSRVTLFYLDKNSTGYVMIRGIAQLVTDPKEKERRWKPEWKAFYPDKPKGYLLIKISPKSMEVVSYKYNILGDSETWQPPVLLFE